MMPTKFNSIEIQKFKDALTEIGKDPNKVDPEAESTIVEILTEKRSHVFSNSEAINRILSMPRINSLAVPIAFARSDAGYNDIQDPQPGGGYKDYSEFINDISLRGAGYNDIPDLQNAGYRDYSQWVDDSSLKGYNDGPQDALSNQLSEIFTKNFSLKEKLRNEGLLSDYLAGMFDAFRIGVFSNKDFGK